MPAAQARIEGLGVNAIDRRRVDVAVDLTPCLEPVDVDMVIVGPQDDELSCLRLVQSRDWTLDKVMHLRQDAQSGEHTLHVGIFYKEGLVDRAVRRFTFPQSESQVAP